MPVRAPIVAGQFYPASSEQCRAELEQCLAAAVHLAKPPTDEDRGSGGQATIDHPIGGIAPHAGWVCSGSVAAYVIRELTKNRELETCVVFGAVHRMSQPHAAVFDKGTWRTPLGDVPIDEELAAAVVQASSMIVADHPMHRREHSIEVEIPFVQHFAPKAKLLPMMVPPSAWSHEAGRIVAQQIRSLGRKAVFVGSTDLTHYGPRYGFTPHGTGPAALKWAKEVNDQRILDLMLKLQAEHVVQEAEQHHNACGSGAVAATIAACRELGASKASVLCHTTSYEVLRSQLGEMDDAVGYAGVVFG